jgi:16S rRNA (uracil1498-N3)-methyltransferase
MSVPRFHVATDIGVGDVGREDRAADAPRHHALRVLRLATGDALTLFTGAAANSPPRSCASDKRDAWVRLDAFSRPSSASRRFRSRWSKAFPPNDAMDFVVRRAVELGVAAVQPVIAARGARFPSDERGGKRLAHWRQSRCPPANNAAAIASRPVHDGADLDAWLAARAAARAGHRARSGG